MSNNAKAITFVSHYHRLGTGRISHPLRAGMALHPSGR